MNTTLVVLGVCKECGAIKEFASEHARDLWLKFHPHQEPA